MGITSATHPIKAIAGVVAVLALVLVHSQVAAQAASAPEQPASELETGVGFKTVAEALETLEAIPGARVSVTQPDSWVIVSEPDGMVVWSFVPSTHPAYPAVVRRAVVVGSDKMARLQMTGLCQAQKAPCDKLMEEFRELNDKAALAVQEGLKGSKQQ